MSAGGIYAGLTGIGDYSASTYSTSELGGNILLVLQGDLTLIPAPAGLCLFGLAGVLRRSRRR